MKYSNLSVLFSMAYSLSGVLLSINEMCMIGGFLLGVCCICGAIEGNKNV